MKKHKMEIQHEFLKIVVSKSLSVEGIWSDYIRVPSAIHLLRPTCCNSGSFGRSFAGLENLIDGDLDTS